MSKPFFLVAGTTGMNLALFVHTASVHLPSNPFLPVLIRALRPAVPGHERESRGACFL